jgi:uracil-DNA glycosylase family 4
MNWTNDVECVRTESGQDAWGRINLAIQDCRRCPRLRAHCRHIAQTKRSAYSDWEYWGLPVPNLGSHAVPLLIVGLAPGAHGANRTGRMFTGDRSGDWLFRAMYQNGFANQAISQSIDDGLELISCSITSVCHCAPPDNRPNRDEISNCRGFLMQTISACSPIVFVALGGVAWKELVGFGIENLWLERPRPKFEHGKVVPMHGGRWLIGSYHPSQQNTFTGKLTESMLDDVFATARQLIQRNNA